MPSRVASGRNPVALCLEPHDLVLSKCVADRERDWEFAREALRGNVVTAEGLLTRIHLLPISRERQERIRTGLRRLVGALYP